MTCTLMRCTPMGCTPTKCTPMRRTPVRYMPVREAYRERHSHKRYAPAKDACPRDACLREMVRSPYWINGKAGSGKSTLMRFIYCSPCTQQALHKRAGNLELETASFLGGRLSSYGHVEQKFKVVATGPPMPQP
jgi:hypothetical protein